MFIGKLPNKSANPSIWLVFANRPAMYVREPNKDLMVAWIAGYCAGTGDGFENEIRNYLQSGDKPWYDKIEDKARSEDKKWNEKFLEIVREMYLSYRRDDE